MFKFNKNTKPQTSRGQSRYDQHKSRMATRSREKAAQVREISEDFPRRRGRKTRAAAVQSLAVFCRTCFPDVFDLPFSADHHRVIASIERAVTTGGLFALAMPRGSGKSALCSAAVLWAALRGTVPFSMLIGANKEAAVEMLTGIKIQLETNDHLLANFPEVCYPIRRLEQINQRKLLWKGEPIRMKFTADRITLPSLPPSPAAGATICVAGLTGRIRGRKITRDDGKEIRPSLVILDDPQDDESANSLSQNNARERIVKGTILGMAGPGKKIAAVCPCTVIAPDDLADRLLDRKRNPEWSGIRTSLVRRWPEGEDAQAHWAKYREIQEESFILERGPEAENAYYAEHRGAMDAGAEVSWPERFGLTELSAIQHAFNLRFRSPETFDAEYQNKPRRADDNDAEVLTPSKIVTRVNGYDRRSVPLDAQYLTSFIDVQQSLLFWSVVAWAPDFTGYLVDYGAWPKQSAGYWTLAKVKKTLATMYGGLPLESQLNSGLTGLAADLAGATWKRPDGSELQLARSLVDANWGASTDTVYAFCASPAGRSINAIPSHGRFVGASSNPMSDWQRKPGDMVGLNWKIPAMATGRQIRHAVWDANFWKTTITDRLRIPTTARGAFSLFGSDPEFHRLLADHLTSEYRVKTSARGRTVDEWKQRPNAPDNHWFDCVVGAAVAASIAGAQLTTATTTPVKRRRRGVRYS